MTLVEMIETHSRKLTDKTAIIHRDSKIAYGELNKLVNKLANALVGMGIKKGDRVGMMLYRTPELVISFLAIAKVKGIVVPMNFELLDNKLGGLLQSTRPNLLIIHKNFLDLARRSIPSGMNIPIIVVGNQTNNNVFHWNEITKDNKSDNLPAKIEDGDIVYLNYTSGSTGNPKGAVTNHAHIYWNTIAAVDALKLTPDDVHLCMFAPFAHPHEIFARPLYLGGTMVLLDNVYPKSLAKAIADHKVTCIMGLAPMYETLLDMLEHHTYDLSSLRVPESGGMYTRTELIGRFKREVGIPIIPVWGSTETTGIAIATTPGQRIVPGSAGKPCSSYEVKIVDDDNEVGTGEIGEMIFSGPAVVNEYHENVSDDRNCFKNGWYYSGDLGRRDSEGNIYFIERKAGMMKVAGLKVYPLEIELALMAHPHIKEVAVIPSQDRLRGEVPKAIIVAKEGKEITEKEVLAFCRERMAHYNVPRVIEIRDSLPRIGSGKINKKLLQEAAA